MKPSKVFMLGATAPANATGARGLSPVAVILDTARDERERLIAYASAARLTVDEVTYRATMAVVDAAVASGRRSQVPAQLRTCGDSSREVLRLDLLVRTLREALQVARGEVLTDEVIEQRARNAAQAVGYAMAAFDDEVTEPI